MCVCACVSRSIVTRMHKTPAPSLRECKLCQVLRTFSHAVKCLIWHGSRESTYACIMVVCARMHACMHTYKHTCTCVCSCASLYVRVCVYIYIYAHVPALQPAMKPAMKLAATHRAQVGDIVLLTYRERRGSPDLGLLQFKLPQ